MIKKRKQKSMIARILFNQLSFALLGAVILIAITVPLARNINQTYQTNKEIKDLEEEIQSLETKNGELEELLGYLESDQFIEEQARLKLNYKSEGEEVYVVKDDDRLSNSSVNETTPEYASMETGINEKTSNIKKWYDYFFNFKS